MESHMHRLTSRIIDVAISVHRHLGPGLLESAYQRCLEIGFRKEGLHFESQKSLGLEFEGEHIPDVYRLDFLVEKFVIVEVKSVQRWESIFDAQILTYLRLTGIQVGLVLNFNTPLRNGIRRIVLNFDESSASPAPLR